MTFGTRTRFDPYPLREIAGEKVFARGDLVVRIMIEKKMFDEAWRIVGEHGASRGVKEALTNASAATHASRRLLSMIDLSQH